MSESNTQDGSLASLASVKEMLFECWENSNALNRGGTPSFVQYLRKLFDVQNEALFPMGNLVVRRWQVYELLKAESRLQREKIGMRVIPGDTRKRRGNVIALFDPS